MELKEYQIRALDAFVRWRHELAAAQERSATAVAALEQAGVPVPADIRNHPKGAWQTLAEAGQVAKPFLPYVERTAAAGFPIPHLCFKVPTGGGKTLLGAAALERLNRSSGLTLWMVPSNAIYQQTREKLWDRQHPYRQMLERGSGGRVKMLEKDDPFTAADVEHYLCVMLLSLQSANRRNNRDFLRMFRDSGRYTSFFPASDDAMANARLLERFTDLDPSAPDRPIAKQSLFNVFKMKRPVVVLDEAHKAYGRQGNESDEFVQSVNRLNPGLVIELSATPSCARSNLLVDIPGSELKAEEMIKLPVQVTCFTNADWHHTLGQAHAKLEQLDHEAVSLQNNKGRTIRPMGVVRVERTGSNQREGDHVHAEDVRDYLVQNLGVPSGAVAVQSSTSRELAGIDLLSEFSPVRWIITKAALMEGWDCPFAYLLVMLDNTKAKRAITQLVGRVMRQPHARLTGRESLDQCHVYCQSTDVNAAVESVKQGLEQEGMGDLKDNVYANHGTAFKMKTVQRRGKFKDTEIFLPKVLHRDVNGGWEELDYQRHILPDINTATINAPDPQSAQAAHPLEIRATVDLAADGASSTCDNPQAVHIDESVKIAWYARRISDILPNPFQAARIAQDLVQKARDTGADDKAIFGQRSALASQLREYVANAMDHQAEQVFRGKLASEEIRFDLEASDHNHRMRKCYEIPVADNAVQLQHYGQSVQLSLFEPVFDRDFNDLERRFAFYLDEQKALQWWHRIAVRQHGEYYLRGWRRERIWPDFVAMGGETRGKPSVLVFETKGRHLDANENTTYKKRVFSALEQTFNAGQVTIHDGPAKGVFRLVFDREGFPDAQTAFDSIT
ncbi:MAG: DEAD/DEAH box helicase family protein [Cyanobacteria bacterium MAG IRC4_bin_6]|nr:DEAD/DEAH box helicase family protein [Cyanobacteria bacterium MAG IRC4_bin_6]